VTTFDDITDQVTERRRSAAGERRYREIVEALPVAAWFEPADGSTNVANGRWLEYTGGSAPGPLADTAGVQPGDRHDVVAGWQAAQAAVEPFEATLRLRRHDGVERWHLVRVAPWRGEGGVLQGWIGTATDIDDERQAVLALTDSERQFRELTDTAPMLIWMSGLGGGRTFFNRGWLEFTGRDLSAEIGDGWLGTVHPDDVARYRETYDAAFAEQRRFEVEYRLRRHDGMYRWILDIGVPRRDSNGDLIGFVGSCVDIDERVRGTERARLMADAGLKLDETRDLHGTIAAATSAAIPALADWCLIDLVARDGSLRREGAAAADPTRQPIVERFKDFPTPVDSPRPTARAVARREAILIENLADEGVLRAETGETEPLADLIRSLDARSAIVQPLVARGEVIGAMLFAVGPDRVYGRDDLDATAEYAGRVALAILNAQINLAEQAAREAAERAAERVERLQHLTRSLSIASSRDAVGDLVAREGMPALGATGAVISVVQGDRLRRIASEGDLPHAGEEAVIPLSSPVPIAIAARDARPVWLHDLNVPASDAVDEAARLLVAPSAARSGCAVPLVSDGITFGALGLSFAEPRSFDDNEKALVTAFADLCGQALARVALAGIRERLVADLESERARLEALLQQLPEGLMIAEAPTGRIVLVNDRIEEILRIPRSQIHHIAGGEAYRGFDRDGRELRPEDWPLARAVKGETVRYEEIELERVDGTRIWVSKRASPVLDREGNVVAGVATITDISEVHRARENRTFLANATEVLGSSLDYEETTRHVAELAVPRIADWCAIDILDESGVPRRIAVHHVDPRKIELARRLQDRYPADPDAERGLAFVLRTGKSDTMSDIPPELVEAAAKDDEHRDLLRKLQLRSYMCVPIVAGGEILGALTLVSAESGRSYKPDDLVFAESLAGRAASAIANARLFREASRFKGILDATLDAVIVFDPLTLRISYANRGAMEQLGRANESLIGAEATSVMTELDSIGLRGLVEPLVSGTIDARTETLDYRHRDGRSIPVEVLFQFVEPPGEPGRIVAVARDISDRIEAQANLRRLAESEHARAAELNAVIRAMGDGIFVCGPSGAITLANPAAEITVPDVAERTYAGLLRRLRDPDHVAPALGTRGGPVELRTDDDEERWVEISTFPVARKDDGSGEIETIVMLRDVTAARLSQAIRDTFIGVLSHELRTPVTTIFAGSKVLAREGDHLAPETRREIFSDIAVESERLHRLVEDVIAMTRFGEEEADVGVEPVLIQRVLPVVVRSEERRWPGVTFAIDVPAGLPTAMGDPTYVEQVIRNLLSNAAKYGGPGTTVHIRVATTGDEIRVSIADDGPGFPPDEAERVFELFFRSEKTASTAAGAGIGLFVCARLIRAMGGRIWAAPAPNGGAEFSFTLRVMSEDD
jgi:PAS domain S-box-containing protein